MYSTFWSTMLFLIFSFLFSLHVFSSSLKSSSINNEPVISSTLSNQDVTSFAEDEFGFIWISTIRGLNRYNNHEFTQYLKTNDSLSISDNRINKIYKDSKNQLWVATTNGICRYNAYNKFDRIPIDGNKGNVIGFCENSDGTLFINLGFEICTYNVEKNKFEIVINNINNINNNFIIESFIDRSNNLWVIKQFEIQQYNSRTLDLIQTFKFDNQITSAFLSQNDKLYLCSWNLYKILDTKTEKFIPLPEIIAKHPILSSTTVNHIYKLNNSSILIYTQKDGLFLYNHILNKITHQSESGFPYDIPLNTEITDIFTDSNKNLWLGTRDQGFIVRYSYKERFNNNSFLTAGLKNKSVLSITKDQSDNLWILTRTNGLYTYNSKQSSLKHFVKDDIITNTSKHGLEHKIKNIFADHQGNLWLMADRILLKAKYTQNRIHIVHTYSFPEGLLSITQDSNDNIWLGGGYNYLYYLKPNEKEFKKMILYRDKFTFTTILLPLSNDKLLVGSFDNDMQLIDTKSMVTTSIQTLDQMKKTKFIPVCAYEDLQQNIWLGTLTNGLFLYDSKAKQLKQIEGISCSEISSISEDISGNIWVGTLYGLSKYDRTTEEFINFYLEDGIGGNQFNERSVYRQNDNTLIFGGTHGLTSFNPINVGYKSSIPVEFENLKINNKIIQPGENQPISKNLTYKPNIKLLHNQNSFTISFSAVDYSEFERVSYAYKLEGFDKFWTTTDKNNEAVYAGIPAGKYKFTVKTYNDEGTITSTENSINVEVKNAPWLNWPALLIYLIIFSTALYFVVRTRRKLKLNLDQIREAEREKEQEQKINQMNMSFFSNLSHEFRTPLTMISGPIATLHNSSSISGKNKYLLQIVDHSIKRMLRLVNQLMDFNKLENDTLKLKVHLTDIIGEINNNIDIFRINALEKDISINTYGLEDNFVMWLDTDKLEKILANIISNALKFSLPNSTIDINFDVITCEEANKQFHITDTDQSCHKQYAKISIADSGIGVPQDQLEKIFERYYQYENNVERHNAWGTGIGLYYTRCLVNLHHGVIKAYNRNSGGTKLSFIIPVDESAYKNDKKITLESQKQTNLHKELPTPQPVIDNDNTQIEKEVILIIDDDMDIIHYLRTILSTHYEIHYKFDADSAYKSMKEIQPKLILCDVIMPGTTGYEFCKMVKDNISYCHIPIILLTAKDAVKDQVEGLNTGADAYVTKPFDPSYLQALVNSQLNNRKKLQSLLKNATKTDKMDMNLLSPHDNHFMTELYALMEKELSNPELNIESITKILSISRTKFYYKVKGLTGSNPNVFFKSYKLNRAAELINEGEKNISEIADITGFNTLSHFSSSFKKHFGVSPRNYAENKTVTKS